MITEADQVRHRPTTPVRAGFDYVGTLTLVAACASIVGLACVEMWQVFARYVLNSSPSWTEPVALLLMTTAMMMGAALGVRSNRHFGFFILVESASPVVRRALLFVARAIAAGVGVMLAGWGGEMTVDGWSYAMAGAPLPQGIACLPLCVGGVLITLFALEGMFAGDADREQGG